MHKENIFELYNKQNPTPATTPTTHEVIRPDDVVAEVVRPEQNDVVVADVTPAETTVETTAETVENLKESEVIENVEHSSV